jgi:5-methylcytosine-specific restriction endonuclease McrA
MPKKRRAKKHFRSSSRNYDDAAYAEFRKAVRKRDGNKCRYPGCNSTKYLHVHHIKKWASHPSMRYDTTNGITLCKKCHDVTHGNEEVYEAFFYKILEWDAIQRLNKRDKDE